MVDVPPHDLEAEAAVLGAILVDPAAIDSAAERLVRDDFYSGAYGWVYQTALDLHGDGQPVDLLTVTARMKQNGRLSTVGSSANLTELLNAVPAVRNVVAYCDVVSDLAKRRRLIATCQRLAAEGYHHTGPASEYIDRAEQAVYELASGARAGGSGAETALTILKREFTKIRDMATSGVDVSGVPTGFDRLDRMTGGLHRSDLTILAARPGVGKTSLAIGIAGSVASKQHGVAVFSLEMPREQIIHRLLGLLSGVDVKKFRTPRLLTPVDWNVLTPASTLIGAMPLQVDDTPAISLMELRAKVRRSASELAAKGKELGLVVVDYLQLMRGTKEVREQEVGEISRGLKSLAKEMRVPVLALSQLNRDAEKKSRPQLSDLRESGAIEQDADNVLFIWRDDKEAEIIIAKQRNGPTGTVKVGFVPHSTKFYDLPDDGPYDSA